MKSKIKKILVDYRSDDNLTLDDAAERILSLFNENYSETIKNFKKIEQHGTNNKN